MCEGNGECVCNECKCDLIEVCDLIEINKFIGMYVTLAWLVGEPLSVVVVGEKYIRYTKDFTHQ